MGRGGNMSSEDNYEDKKELTKYSWSQIKENNKWLVINGLVYDVTNFSKIHPGGERLLLHHIGQDTTDAFVAFHTDMTKVNKYLKTLRIGRVIPESENSNEEHRSDIIRDFQDLRSLAEKMNLFKANQTFFLLNFLQLVVLEIFAWILIYFSGTENWLSYFLAVTLLVTAQAQAGWLQHDFGHLSVFKSNKLNHFMHRVTICFFKGVSSDWWNYRHFQHHAKPNLLRKDPDIRFGKFIVLGKVMPIELGQKKVGALKYNLQQFYFFFVVPPLLLPLYFNFENIYFLFKRKDIKETFWALSFFIRWAVIFGPLLGIGGALKLYLLVRFLESHWFVWTTQMSHLSMNIDRDNNLSWFRTQLQSTCNVEQSLFNDWFSGHLNFQIEHHLFPTMPRHNYYKITPYVKSMCKKYGIDYQCKTLSRAMADIYYSLKESGELWHDAYNL